MLENIKKFLGNLTIFRQASSFLVVGFISTVINYSVFAVFLTLIQLPYILASILGYLTGVLMGFYLNSRWTFNSNPEEKRKELFWYFLVYSMSLLTGLGFLRILVEIFGINPLIANIFAVLLIVSINFTGSKFLVFNENFKGLIGDVLPYFTLPFWIILIIKIVSSFLFSPSTVTEGFLPFIDFWTNTLSNPYEHFLTLGERSFPYPSFMLLVLSLPFFMVKSLIPEVVSLSTNLSIFLTHIPVLIADVLIYVILCYLLPTKKKEVLWLYFASPILFYISFIHGQLDAIPIALLFLSLFFLFRGQGVSSAILLGLGIGSKIPLLAALPFFLIYLYRNKIRSVGILEFIVISAGTFIVFNPYILSPSFISVVFNNPEQSRLLAFFIEPGLTGLRLYLAPVALFFILYWYGSFKRLNHDSLMLVLGLFYVAIIALSPPLPSWFYWAVPFLILFLIKFRKNAWKPLWILNIAFILYFLFWQKSDIFESLSPISSYFSLLPAPYRMLNAYGFDASLIQSLLFTFLEAVIIVNIWFVYKLTSLGINQFQAQTKQFSFGIAGDSGVGKSTMLESIKNITGEDNIAYLDGDDLHKWERKDPRWGLFTHLNPKANKLHVDLNHALSLINDREVKRTQYNHDSGKFDLSKTLKSSRFIGFQGLHSFFLEDMRKLYDLKVYIEADEDLQVFWKISRDMRERGYTEEIVREQIQKRKPDSEKYVKPQRNYADWIIKYSFDEQRNIQVEYLLKNSIEIERLVEELSSFQSLEVEHSYSNISFQSLKVSGTIEKSDVENIAYKLFPNMTDLVENYPVFEQDINGINQLFFLNYLDNLYRIKLSHERIF